MADDEQQLISEEWTVQVEELVRTREPVDVSRGSPRLPKAMVNAKADAYIPQMLSLGPYHHRALKDVSVEPYQHRLTHISQMDMYKLKFAREAAGYNAAVIEGVFTEVEELPFMTIFEGFYDWSISAGNGEPRKFGWMMTVDAFFLFQFLKKCMYADYHPSTDVLDTMPFFSSVRCDIVKLENQIPLILLDKVKNAVPAEPPPFDLQTGIKGLSTFPSRYGHFNNLQDEKHLLGCIHKYVSSFLEIQTAKQDTTIPSCWQRISSTVGNMVAAVAARFFRHPVLDGQHDFLNRYNADELLKAGITFKPFPDDGPAKIRFDKYSHTLFLPQIEVADTYTEVLLRNLLALEFNEAEREKAVTHYVELMDCLIDTPEDITLLRHCGVIVRRSMMITDDYVAKMWDGMCKPFFAGVMEPPPALKSQIQDVLRDNFYKSKIRTVWKEFREQYFARPWQVVALLVGIFLLISDTVQTYCNFRDCKTMFHGGGESPPTERSSMAFNRFG